MSKGDKIAFKKTAQSTKRGNQRTMLMIGGTRF